MHRGRSVSLAFLMQGWGQITNQLVLILLLLAFSGPEPPYGAFAAQWVFRLQFGFIAVSTLYLRYYKMQYPEDNVLRDSKERLNISGREVAQAVAGTACSTRPGRGSATTSSSTATRSSRASSSA
jgi:hypothetical protein